ncbi:hypothetical protein AB6N23_00140 [Cellulomonas sp. 179-A 9B4 NHS]|uniref:hypothetical protein n=1 Tax=Cellulomonas sp. 179-A 9B4 NHS TaxID=3142379 RepID=UPI0039A2B20D
MTLTAEHYQQAVSQSGLTGPASSIAVALYPNSRPDAAGITVLVHCDRPDGQELLTARMHRDWDSSSPAEAGWLVSDMLHAGLVRLGVARGWNRTALANALHQAKAAVEQDLGAGAGAGVRRWPVTAEGRGASAPEQPHELRVVGGGPTNGVPTAYLDELSRLLDLLADDSWAEWWSRSPVKLANIFYWFDVARPAVRVRVGAMVTAAIERPVETIDRTHPVGIARADVTALISRLTTRLNLPEPPDLT